MTYETVKVSRPSDRVSWLETLPDTTYLCQRQCTAYSSRFHLEHEPCLAMFCGPVAPPHTRIAVVQNNKDVFRIVAKAVILDPKHQQEQEQQEEEEQPSPDTKHHLKIMKDRKQKTEPHKILKRMNALIKFERKPRKILNRRTALFKFEGIPHKRRTPLLKFESEYIDVAEIKGSPIRTRSRIRGDVKKVKNRKEIATVPVNEDSPKEVDPAQGRLRLEQRRHVEISDEEPSSYPCSSYYMLFRRMGANKLKETVIMSEEKRVELIKKTAD